MRKETRPELLSPAGNLACLKAAVAAGCDAVYFGGQAFNARQNAGNFSREEIREAVAFCAFHGVKTYLTLNTLVKEKEWPLLAAYLRETLSLGISAVIVQDPGVAELVRAWFPGTELHASTQMAVQDAAGVRCLEELGFKRVVLARELSLEEIRAIRQATKAELEVFIHGALCCSYSGRCLLSSFHGGRSGNRGTCAQPCRLAYRQENGPQYPMNLKDLCAADRLDALAEAGVDSFKIEGRMKGIPYVTGITAIYRRLLEEWQVEGKSRGLTLEDRDRMRQLFNRGGFTDGYLAGDKRSMLAPESPKHQGLPIGRVESVRGPEVTLRLEAEAAPGDVLEIRTEQEPYPELRVAASMIQGRTLRFRLNGPFKKGQTVCRLVDIRLNEELQKRAGEYPTVPLFMRAELTEGEPLRLEGCVRGRRLRVEGETMQKAQKRALTEEAVQRQLERLGGTGFRAETVEVSIKGDCFLPASALNAARRDLAEQAVQLLQPTTVQPREAYLPSPVEKTEEQWQVAVATAEQWRAVLEDGPDMILPPLYWSGSEAERQALTEESRRRGIRVVPECPPVSRMKHEERFREALAQWKALGVREFEAQLLGQLSMIREAGGIGLAGLGLAVMNRAAAAFWQSRAEGFFLSIELTGEEMRPLTGLAGATVLVYGKIPLMVTEQCFYQNQQGCRPSAQGHRVTLKDRYGTALTACSHCETCYTVLYEETPLWLGDKPWRGVRRRLEFTDETAARVRTIRQAAREQQPLAGTTQGHYTKGVQ